MPLPVDFEPSNNCINKPRKRQDNILAVRAAAPDWAIRATIRNIIHSSDSDPYAHATVLYYSSPTQYTLMHVKKVNGRWIAEDDKRRK
ncbi:MAG: hypothetical protein Q9164_005647 [Protoblastenia rupestris]